MPAKRGGTSKGGGAKALNKEKSTPSGYTYEEFLSKSIEEREQIIVDIIDSDIDVPDYLDKSDTQKVLYALGMDGKPQMMSDSQLDALPGQDLFRTVNGNKYLSAGEIIDQVKEGDYTRLSDSGGSAYGRGIYFANKLDESLVYGYKEDSAVMRAKLLPDAKVATYQDVYKGYKSANKFKTDPILKLVGSDDKESLWALSRGYDAWFDPGSGYHVVLNRAKTAASKVTKYFNGAQDATWDYSSWNDMRNYMR